MMLMAAAAGPFRAAAVVARARPDAGDLGSEAGDRGSGGSTVAAVEDGACGSGRWRGDSTQIWVVWA